MEWFSLVSLLAASLLVPIAFIKAGDLRVPLWPFIVSILLMSGISLANVLYGPLPGAENDAKTFHDRAVVGVVEGDWPFASLGTGIYMRFLSIAYFWLGPELIVGQTLSIIAAGLSLVAMGQALLTAGIQNRAISAFTIAAIGIFPTFLYHNALTFREPFQTLGFSIGMLFALRAFQEARFAPLVYAAAGFLIMGLFHQILMLAGILMIAVSVMLVQVRQGGEFTEYLKAVGYATGVLVLGAVLVAVFPTTSDNDYVKDFWAETHEDMGPEDLAKQSPVPALMKYRTDIESRVPRTDFGIEIDASTPLGLVLGLSENYVATLIRPYPVEIEGVDDLVVFVCSLVRVVCFLFCLVYIAGRGWRSGPLLLMFAAYLLVTFVWSVGTTNYGQAFRHHATTDWLLLLLTGLAIDRYRHRHRVDEAAI